MIEGILEVLGRLFGSHLGECCRQEADSRRERGKLRVEMLGGLSDIERALRKSIGVRDGFPVGSGEVSVQEYPHLIRMQVKQADDLLKGVRQTFRGWCEKGPIARKDGEVVLRRGEGTLDEMERCLRSIELDACDLDKLNRCDPNCPDATQWRESRRRLQSVDSGRLGVPGNPHLDGLRELTREFEETLREQPRRAFWRR